MREFKQNGFSLMEMMIVLLIVAIVAAASAPLVSKKMTSDAAGSSGGFWSGVGDDNSIGYNLSGNSRSVLIGASKVPDGSSPKLYIESSGNEAQIGFGKKGSNKVLSLTMDTAKNRVGFSDAEITEKTVAMGTEQTIAADGVESVVIGHSAKCYSDRSICIGGDNTTAGAGGNASFPGRYNIAIGYGATASRNLGLAIGFNANADGINSNDAGTKAYIGAIAIGPQTNANGENSIAVGSLATASGFDSVAIGPASTSDDTGKTLASGKRSIAIGTNAQAIEENSVAIGTGAQAKHKNSVAIGNGAITIKDNQIAIGGPNAHVYIRGAIYVDQSAILGRMPGSMIMLRANNNGDEQWGTQDRFFTLKHKGGDLNAEWTSDPNSVEPSDRRLKNVGEKFTAGINELSKLEFFHYTFKKDETKTPHVGVIAQDLQKVFPDAVTKGDDGFLRIRWEDMFYAAINAIKELNVKITEIVQNITDTNAKIEEQAKIIEAQQKNIEKQQEIIDNQQKTIEEQQKSIDKLLKRMEKVEKKI